MSEQEYYDDFEKFTFEFRDEELKYKFKDYLIHKEISGTKRGYPHGTYIPSDMVEDTGKVVEVSREEQPEKQEDHDKNSILIHRNTDNEIESIEIICSCGKQTIVKLNYDDVVFREEEIRGTMSSTDEMRFEGTDGADDKERLG
jgi:hypothetical protein